MALPGVTCSAPVPRALMGHARTDPPAGPHVTHHKQGDDLIARQADWSASRLRSENASAIALCAASQARRSPHRNASLTSFVMMVRGSSNSRISATVVGGGGWGWSYQIRPYKLTTLPPHSSVPSLDVIREIYAARERIAVQY
jgi:hypothetical protein